MSAGIIFDQQIILADDIDDPDASNWIIPSKVGPADAIWTDLETLGIVNVSVLLFGDPVSVARVA
jgi:hypothetical protein